MEERKQLSDDELKALVDAEIASSMGEFGVGGELSEDRADAMDRYLGEPMGNEIVGRSQVHARDVLTTIEWILPSLIKIFTDEDAVEIQPVGPEDEEAAEQETDYLHHLFFVKNNGFLILYSWFKDALLQKNGITKHWVDESEEKTRETYVGLSGDEFALLFGDDELDLIEHEEKLDGTHDATFARTCKDTRIEVEVIPPEEFLISKDARSVDPKKARFVGQYTFPTVSDLREMGYKDAQIDDMEDAPGSKSDSEEGIARRHLSDEEGEGNIVNRSMRQKQVVEGYLKADRNGDGIAELLKIVRSGDFIEYEEVDSVPFNAITPIILTHKFFGMSVADLLIDIQEIRTSLIRNYLDNIYQTVNGTTYYNENTVNLDDMLTSQPYGIRAVDGSPNDAILHIPPGALPAQAYQLLDVVDRMRTDRLGDFQTQLDPQVLKDANTGVVSELMSEAKAKVEMIARIFAETGVRQLFRDLHELARKHSNKEEIVKLRNTWAPVDPRQWRERTDFRVKVGLGTRNRRERQFMLRELMSLQEKMVAMGGMGSLITPKNIYNTLHEFISTYGEPNPDSYIMDPEKAPPPPPPQPDINMMIAQIEAQKNQMNGQLKAKELEIRQQEGMAKAQLEQMKQEIAAARAQSQNATDQAKIALDAQVFQMEDELAKAKFLVESQQEWRQQVLEQFKIELQSMTDLAIAKTQAKDDLQNNVQADQERLATTLGHMMGQMEKLQGSMDSPKNILRDSQGRIISVGNKKVKRDENGFLAGIE